LPTDSTILYFSFSFLFSAETTMQDTEQTSKILKQTSPAQAQMTRKTGGSGLPSI
jgi:hypothetical protein